MRDFLSTPESPEREPGEEADLIRTIRSEGASDAGRRAADRLLRPYQRRVYLWCYRYVGNHERALDLAQEVFVRVWRGLARFEGRSSFSLWVFAITRNCCRSAVRRPEPIIDADVDALVVGGGSSPAGEYEEREGAERLLALIRRALDHVEQKAIWMRCIECVPVETITEALEISEKSGARAVLQRARRKLRAALDAGDGAREER